MKLGFKEGGMRPITVGLLLSLLIGVSACKSTQPCSYETLVASAGPFLKCDCDGVERLPTAEEVRNYRYSVGIVHTVCDGKIRSLSFTGEQQLDGHRLDLLFGRAHPH
jgi:hypothetical protein